MFISLVCVRCKVEKPAAEMGRDRRKPGGIDTRCKACLTASKRAAYQADPSVLEKQRANRRANLARYRQYQKDWREQYPERARKWVADYRATHSKEAAERMRRWQIENPEKVRLHAETRRARKVNAPVCDLTHDQWLSILEAYAYRCAYCGGLPDRLDQEHVIPLSKGGNHTATNVVPACRPCNQRKGTSTGMVPMDPAALDVAIREGGQHGPA